MNLTELELKTLKAIDASEYGDYLHDDIWTFSIADNICDSVQPKQISGIVSSLVKKGLVCIGSMDGDDYVGMTDAGVAAYIDAVGADNVQKIIN